MGPSTNRIFGAWATVQTTSGSSSPESIFSGTIRLCFSHKVRALSVCSGVSPARFAKEAAVKRVNVEGFTSAKKRSTSRKTGSQRSANSPVTASSSRSRAVSSGLLSQTRPISPLKYTIPRSSEEKPLCASGWSAKYCRTSSGVFDLPDGFHEFQILK